MQEFSPLTTNDNAADTAAINSKSTVQDRQNALARYFQEMSAGGLLDADGEATLAASLRDHDEAIWAALLGDAKLSHGIADFLTSQTEASKQVSLRSVKTAATRHLRSQTKTTEMTLRRAASKAAAKLRDIDPDQDLQNAAIAQLDRILAGEPHELKIANAASLRTDILAKREELGGLRKIANQTRNTFVESNLGLVVSVARRYQFSDMALADLIQEGNLGLLKAVGRFDERRGFRFSTYATWWIRHAIGRAVADKSRTVRVPVHVTEASQKIRKTRQELTLKLGREATREEVAEAVGMSVVKIDKTVERARGYSLSLDAPIGEDNDRERLDVFTTDESSSAFDKISALALSARATKALETLAPLEIEILNRRFGLAGKTATTLQEIANTIGKSRERIRQIQENALSKLRERLIAEHAV